MAKNPALASLTTGAKAKPSTLEQLLRDRPELNALYEKHFESDDLLDMRPVLARAKALSEWVMSRIDPSLSDSESGCALVIRAIQSLSHVVRAAREMLEIEQRLGPVTRTELRRMAIRVAATIQEFVPAERRAEALAFIVSVDEMKVDPRAWTDAQLEAYTKGLPLAEVLAMGEHRSRPRSAEG